MKANKAIIIGIIAVVFFAFAGCAQKPEPPAAERQEAPEEQTVQPQPPLPESPPAEEPSPVQPPMEESAPAPSPEESSELPHPPAEEPEPVLAPPPAGENVTPPVQQMPSGHFPALAVRPGRTSAQIPAEAEAPASVPQPAPAVPISAQVPSPEEHSISQQDSFEAIDQTLKKMEQANIAFNAPSSMRLNETAVIHLVLGFEKEIDELKQMIQGEGEREGARIRVTCRMKASLTGSNFSIKKITPEMQLLSKSEVTEWRWEVKPASEGRQNLHLTLTAFIDADGKSTPRAIRTFDRMISVEVTFRDRISAFIEENWQWLWATILVPLCGWLWKKMKGGKAKGA
jgi:hypothetical protein